MTDMIDYYSRFMVHGTTEKDIVKFIEQAKEESDHNKDSKLDTVVFFDEANTTDAIGLIKEIMCDRRINGRPISDDLKFIAACNPYKKYCVNNVCGNNIVTINIIL